MIAFDQVSKRYGRGQAALQDVTFTLERGDFAFITGSSGAGKTTLIKMIYREVRPSSGRVLVDGQDLGSLRPRQVQLLRRRLGVVFQSGRLIGSRDVYENVTFVLRAIGMGPKQQKERALAVLRWVGLTHRMRSFPGELSGGEQQRIAIARAVAADPEVLLADEPTGNLDAGLSQEILAIFQKINGRGTTVLVATHDQELIQKTRRRVIRLEGGRLVDERMGRQPQAHEVPADDVVTITDGFEAPEERLR